MCAQVLVERLGWLSNGVFLELLALCQCLPGPSSTQLSFALGITQQGAAGGLLSGQMTPPVDLAAGCSTTQA